MKNFLKIFMTVVAGMMAFSCVTDTTDDLGVNLGKGQKTVISVSLEESRTYLGALADNKYPMYWSAGDKISVNGVESEAAVIKTDNAAVASFVVNGLGEPDHYFVTYPAVANAESKWQVKFATEQAHTEGTFDNNVSTMYGYSEDNMNVQMNHLTGVLKIGIKGTATLVKAQISTVSAPIAGTFDFAFEKDAEGNVLLDEEGNRVPKLTPTADATNVITYIFGDESDGGFPLSEDTPLYIHATVPAGEYNYLHVTLFDDAEQVMVANVKADDTKPLNAGVVREFYSLVDGEKTEQFIHFTPNTTDYYIADYANLVEYKNQHAKTKNALMVANVTVPEDGGDWESIDEFAGTFNGNGYEIKGLKAPLFKNTTTTAVIKNVKLSDVEIVSEDAAVIGALVCHFKGTELSNCTTSGSVSVDLSNATTYCAVGGIAGIVGPLTAAGATSSGLIANLSGLVNNINVTVTGDNSANTSTYTYIGSGIGIANLLAAKNLTNNGNVTVSNEFKTGTAYNHFGGIFGHFRAAGGAIVGDFTNTGNVTVGGTYTGINQFRVGGCAGIFGYGTADTILNVVRNSGTVTISEGISVPAVSESKYMFYCGGISGVCAIVNSDESKTINTGSVVIKGGTFDRYVNVAGGHAYCDKAITHIINEGSVTIEGGTFNANTRLAGCLGVHDKAVSNHTNNGTITVKGGTFNAIAYIGGSIAYGANTITNLYNNKEITLSGGTFNGIAYIGGSVAYGTNTITNLYNNKEITLSGGTFNENLFIGGCLAWMNSKKTLEHYTNTGSISVDGITTTQHLFVGGCMGSYNNSTNTGGSGRNFLNQGSINIGENTDIGGQLVCGGCLARLNLDQSGTLKVLENDAPITVKADITGELSVGGVVGYVNADNNSEDLTNTAKGVITIELNEDLTVLKDKAFRVGGVGAHIQDGTVRLTNNANIYIKGNLSREGFRVGGIIGDINYYYRTNLTNNGDIEISAKSNGNWAVGGIEGGSGSKVKTCYINTGDIKFTETSEVTGYARIGGIASNTTYEPVAFAKNSDGKSSYNSGNITFSGTIKKRADVEDDTNVYYLALGGLIGDQTQILSFSEEGDNILNSGNVVFDGVAIDIPNIYIGGAFANNTGDLSALKGRVNLIDNKVECTGSVTNGSVYVGGVAGVTTTAIKGAYIFSTVNAANHSNVGMLTGSAYNADLTFTDCHIGGSILKGDMAAAKTLSGSNYYDYIYGSGNSEANASGCTYWDGKEE